MSHTSVQVHVHWYLKKMVMIVCLEMAPKSNDSNHVFSLRRHDIVWQTPQCEHEEHICFYSALLAYCAHNLLTLYWLISICSNNYNLFSI